MFSLAARISAVTRIMAASTAACRSLRCSASMSERRLNNATAEAFSFAKTGSAKTEGSVLENAAKKLLAPSLTRFCCASSAFICAFSPAVAVACFSFSSLFCLSSSDTIELYRSITGPYSSGLSFIKSLADIGFSDAPAIHPASLIRRRISVIWFWSSTCLSV